MTDVKPNAATRWKVAGCFAAALLIMAVAITSYVRTIGSRKWAAMESRVAFLAQEARSRSRTRPVLRGPVEGGNAWDQEYSEAFRWVQSPDGNSHSGAGFEDVALTLLRQGTRRADGKPYHTWDSPSSQDHPGHAISTYYLDIIFNRGIRRSRQWFGEGRCRESAEVLLDLAQAAGDFARDSGYLDLCIGTGYQEMVLGELKGIILSGRMAKEDLRDVASQLEILDGSFPRLSEPVANCVVASGFRYLRIGDLEKYYDLKGYPPAEARASRLRSWRTLFSDRWTLADAFFRQLEWMERLAAAEGGPWLKVQELCREADSEIGSRRDHLMEWWPADLATREMHLRRQRMKMRMLRVAAYFLGTAEVLDLEDPFGDKLHHIKEGERLKVWSVGPDGIDHKGVDDWDAAQGKDIVLEVSR